ncbi:MAG: NYN domain-containing protein [Desulfomonilia bacterium]|jgi:uncharacterized LabA/DUF88 family protein|nr:NYN domain-containing protein [Pseudomonadota bacterium]
MERVVIFVDGSNLYNSLKKNFGKVQIDFRVLAEKLTNPTRKLVRLYYYNAPRDKSEGDTKYKAQQRFLEKLRRTDYVEVKLGRLESRPIDLSFLSDADRKKYSKMAPKKCWVEKGVDVSLAVDMLTMAIRGTYDTAIIVSNDGDFASAIMAVKDLGKHVEVGHIDGSSAYHLLTVADKEICIDKDLLKDCWLDIPKPKVAASHKP